MQQLLRFVSRSFFIGPLEQDHVDAVVNKFGGPEIKVGRPCLTFTRPKFHLHMCVSVCGAGACQASCDRVLGETWRIG